MITPIPRLFAIAAAITMLAAVVLPSTAVTETVPDQDDLRYFVLMAKPHPAVWDKLVTDPQDPEAAAKAFIEGMPGAKLVAYFIAAYEPLSISIVALPNTRDASALVYQRIGTQLIEDIEIIEVLKGVEFMEVLELAKALRSGDSYSRPGEMDSADLSQE